MSRAGMTPSESESASRAGMTELWIPVSATWVTPSESGPALRAGMNPAWS
ncbi:hypothetical protein [Wolbachia endosymbiont of Ctenocephalides felis wCfeJ]|nr:hypothetical protein [Wolbachia endosymbiont of Ctenocephalides felis wCfeJ]